MNNKSPIKKLLAVKGMGAALTGFAGLIIIYIAFGLINPAVFSSNNILNLLRSMSKYLLIGIAQSYVLITGNIDLSIGSMVAMSAMISATLMTLGTNPFLAVTVALLCCLVISAIFMSPPEAAGVCASVASVLAPAPVSAALLPHPAKDVAANVRQQSIANNFFFILCPPF